MRDVREWAREFIEQWESNDSTLPEAIAAVLTEARREAFLEAQRIAGDWGANDMQHQCSVTAMISARRKEVCGE